MKYSFIIPQYAHSVDQFSVFASRQDTEVIIIITGHIMEHAIDCKYIHMPGAGYGEAINEGVRIAQGEILIICNDDIMPDRQFMDFISDANIQLPVVYDIEGRLESMGSHLNAMGYGKMNNRIEEQVLITGSVFIIKHAIMMQYMMDEDYFLYYEDTDLGMRLIREYSIEINKELKVHHKHSFSSGHIKRYYLQRNRLLLLTKFRHIIGNLRYLFIFTAEPVIMYIQIIMSMSLQPLQARIDALSLLRRFNEKAKDIH